MATLELRQVEKRFNNLAVIKPLDLVVEDREFVVFVGPSGCGKTTLLRMIAGLEDASGGTILIDGADVTRMQAASRKIAMVFQSYALYPHMTVEENIGFGLKIARVPVAERRQKVLEAARILQLEPLLARRPKQLSGGQRQRVAIGRAIVKNPGIFLFDEPLSNLDAELRVQMRLEIARLHQDLGATMIYVTHDQVEAMTLADKIVVLRGGVIEQVGAPIDLYENPANAFVAGFIGSPRMNFVDGKVVSANPGLVTIHVPALGSQTLPVAVSHHVAVGADVTLGFRPEHCTIADTGAYSVRIDVVERLGNVAYAYAKASDGTAITIECRNGEPVRPGDTVSVSVAGSQAFLFDSDGARI